MNSTGIYSRAEMKQTKSVLEDLEGLDVSILRANHE